MEDQELVLERSETGIRILYTILFAVINRLLGGILALVIVFQLIYSLVTMRPPSERIRSFGNRLIAYIYRLQRYMTHNEPELPFPFNDLPDELEPPRWPYEEKSTETAPVDLDPAHGT